MISRGVTTDNYTNNTRVRTNTGTEMAMSVADMDGVQECVYHLDRWRCDVQAVCNQLRGRLIPNKFIKMIGKIVCTCHAAGQNDDGDFAVSIRQLTSWYNSEVFDKTGHGLVSIEHILQRMLIGLTMASTSRKRFLVIVKNVLTNDLSIFKTKDALKKGDNRQKYLYDEEFSLPMTTTYLGNFIGKDGSYLKPLCQKYNCEIHFSSIDRYRRVTAKSVDITVKAQSVSNLNDVKEDLLQRMKTVVLKRTRHLEKVTAYNDIKQERMKKRQAARQKRIDQYGLRYIKGSYNFWKAADEMKENYRVTYSIKQKHTSMGRKAKSLGVLEEGSRCVYCLMPFAKNATEEGACHFHPGFLLAKENGTSNRRWSCCDIEVENGEQEDQLASHKETGCQYGRHNWRLCKSTKSRKEIKPECIEQ